MRTFIFYEMIRLQYNLSIGCSTEWRKYGIIIRKLQMFIIVAMEKLYEAHYIFTKPYQLIRLCALPLKSKLYIYEISIYIKL